MKRIKHHRTARDKVLHIETEGAIVNIRVGLSDSEGREVTSIEIIPDGEDRGGDGEGRIWHVDPQVGNVRIIRQSEET